MWIRSRFFQKPTRLDDSEFFADFIRVIGFVTIWSEKFVTVSQKIGLFFVQNSSSSENCSSWNTENVSNWAKTENDDVSKTKSISKIHDHLHQKPYETFSLKCELEIRTIRVFFLYVAKHWNIDTSSHLGEIFKIRSH